MHRYTGHPRSSLHARPALMDQSWWQWNKLQNTSRVYDTSCACLAFLSLSQLLYLETIDRYYATLPNRVQCWRRKPTLYRITSFEKDAPKMNGARLISIHIWIRLTWWQSHCQGRSGEASWECLFVIFMTDKYSWGGVRPCLTTMTRAHGAWVWIESIANDVWSSVNVLFFYVLSNEKLLNRFSDESKLWPIRIQGSVSVPSNHVGSLCSVVPIPI